MRPASERIFTFVEQHWDQFGVAPICRALSRHYDMQIALRSYYAWRGRGPSKRALWDTTITEIYQPDDHRQRPPESLYGATKMWAHLQRQQIPVARCTVERLMRLNGWQGVTRARKIRTTMSDPDGARPEDLVDRNFSATAPNQLMVADFTYVRIPARFVYTAFVIDAFASLAHYVHE